MKKILSILTALFITVLSAAFAVACKTSEKEEYELYGFTPKNEISVTQGDFVELETLYIFDSLDNYYEATYKILNSENQQVELSGKGFFAVEAKDYKIVYTVLCVDGTYKKETLVKVTAKTTSGLNIHIPETITLGETCEIIISDVDKEKYTFTIVAEFNGVKTEIENNSFTPQKIGKYNIKVTAKAGEETIEKTYPLYVSQSMIEGEVEAFNEGFKNARNGWNLTTSSESGLKDRFGEDGSFLSIETEAEYLKFYLVPTMDKSYYEQLAEEGYEYVSLWIYIDGTLPHIVQQFKGYGSFYQTSNNVSPNQWYEIRYNLQDDPKYDYQGSFLKAFNYFASQTQQMITIDNSAAYNSANGGRETDENGAPITYKVYIDDIYAVKKGDEIELNENTPPTAALGETYDLKQLVSSAQAENLAYTVEYRGNSELTESGVYDFNSAGNYTVTIAYGAKTPNLYGTTTLDFEVTSPYTADYTALIKEKTGETLDVDLSELGFVLKNADDETVQTSSLGFTATKNGVQVTVTNGILTAETVGCYDVTVEATFLLNGKTCTTFIDVPVDVWDTDSKYKVFTFDGNSDYFADSYYMNRTWEKKPTTTVVTDYDGKTGDFMKVAIATQQRGFFSIKPLFSKEYYKQLLLSENAYEQFTETMVTFKYKLVDNASVETRKISAYNATTTTSVNCGDWYSMQFTLQEFIDTYYDAMVNGYDYLDSLRGGAGLTVDATKGYGFFYLENNKQYATDIYLGESLVVTPAFNYKYLDVTDTSSANKIFAWDYNWQKLTYDTVFTVQEDKTYVGVTGDMLVYNGTQQSMGFQYLHPNAKAYFEYMLSRYPDAYISVKVLVEVANRNTGDLAQVTALGQSTQKVTLGTWTELQIKLSDIVANYDAMMITEIKNPSRKNFITVANQYYTNTTADCKSMTIYFTGFDYVLGEEATTEE